MIDQAGAPVPVTGQPRRVDGAPGDPDSVALRTMVVR
jgi:hypothetical protein